MKSKVLYPQYLLNSLYRVAIFRIWLLIVKKEIEMNKICLLMLLSVVVLSGEAWAQNANQDGMLQVQEVYGEGQVQTMPVNSNDTNTQTTIPNDNNSSMSDDMGDNGQMTVEETIEAEGVVEND